MADALDFENDRLDALADVVRLAGNLFAARQQAFRLAEADRGGASLKTADGAVDKLALLGVELIKDCVTLFLAEVLN